MSTTVMNRSRRQFLKTSVVATSSRLVQMVASGLGITLLPKLAIASGITEGTGLVLRPLAGEHEGDLGHGVAPVVECVQSIRADPQVRPAPMPVRSTSLPGSSLPSSAASASARGIDPDEVLP